MSHEKAQRSKDRYSKKSVLVYQICSFTKPKSPFSKPLFFLQYILAKIIVNSNCWRPVVLLDLTG